MDAWTMRSGDTTGFTLLELLVVMALLSLALGITVANLAGSTEGAELKTQTRQLVALLRHTRTRAISESLIIGLDATENNTGYRVVPGGETVALPESVEVDISAGLVASGIDRPALFFYPDGSSNGGRVRLASR